MDKPALDITVRIGCSIEYFATMPTPLLFAVKPLIEPHYVIREELFSFGPGQPAEEFQDAHGNLVHRGMLLPGTTVVHHDAIVAVSSQPDLRPAAGSPVPVDQLPWEALRYTLPSRYCDSDKLLDFAWQHFGSVRHGIDRVQAICDWLHHNIEYRYGSGRPDLSASEIIARRYGVCRDFAHTAIALCRCFNIPARYVTGHLPDIAFQDSGSPMDFHAYMEVYIGDGWYTFDARFNVQRIGRVKVAQGLDAVDGAFSTIYGAADLVRFEVWAYQVDAKVVTIGSPIDLSKRMDGTEELRLG